MQINKFYTDTKYNIDFSFIIVNDDLFEIRANYSEDMDTEEFINLNYDALLELYGELQNYFDG